MGATTTDRRCDLCGAPIPADRDPRAKRCSLICTQRAAKNIDPPGVRHCRLCGVEIPVTVDARKKYCSERCRLRSSGRRRRLSRRT